MAGSGLHNRIIFNGGNLGAALVSMSIFVASCEMMPNLSFKRDANARPLI